MIRNWHDTNCATKCSAFRLSVIIVTISSCFGCSFNGFGIPGTIEEEILSTGSALIITTKARGLHLHSVDSIGVHLGYIEREIVYPVISHNSLVCAARLLTSSPFNTIGSDLVYSDDPIQVTSRRTGLGISVSPHSIDAMLGFTHKKVFRVQADSSFSMFYKSFEIQPGVQVCAVIHPPSKGQDYEM